MTCLFVITFSVWLQKLCGTNYPVSIAFIVVNEFCERFSYYGMKGKTMKLNLHLWLWQKMRLFTSSLQVRTHNAGVASVHGNTFFDACYIRHIFFLFWDKCYGSTLEYNVNSIDWKSPIHSSKITIKLYKMFACCNKLCTVLNYFLIKPSKYFVLSNCKC